MKGTETITKIIQKRTDMVSSGKQIYWNGYLRNGKDKEDLYNFGEMESRSSEQARHNRQLITNRRKRLETKQE